MTHLLTASGRMPDLRHLRPDDIHIDDIAESLSHLSRFTGHAHGYSVAAHSIHVSHLVRKLGGSLTAQMAGLLHDAHEAYMGDISTPMQQLINATAGFKVMSVITDQLQWEVLSALKWRSAYHAHRQLIKQADLIALATERRDLMPYHPWPWPILEGIEPDACDLRSQLTVTPATWKAEFLNRYEHLRHACAEALLCEARGGQAA
ncbi:MAG: HD domain-containing protein [Pseudomonadota bacterium]